MPPAALASLTASLTPRYSNCPRSLLLPLCASTTAILIGPDAGAPLPVEPPAGLPELLAPGALHAAAASAAAATATADPMWYLDLADMCSASSGRTGS